MNPSALLIRRTAYTAKRQPMLLGGVFTKPSIIHGVIKHGSVRFVHSESPSGIQTKLVYEGGLTKAAKVMKLASVASLVGASAAVPFFFAGDSDVPSSARTILALTTIGMTGSSTALVTWALKPYIVSLRTIQDYPGFLLIETMSFLAQPRTRLVAVQQLKPAVLPMTSWMCADLEGAEQIEKAAEVIEKINLGRKKDIVGLAKAGDVFYAHTQGQVSEEMRQIIQEAPCQEQ